MNDKSNLTTHTDLKPKSIIWITILMSLTTMRVLAINNLPDLQMLGGIQSNSWLGPWVGDTVFGILTPIMAYFAFKKNGIKVWGMLLVFNALGAFDYLFGFTAQFNSPFIAEGAVGAPEMIYGTLVAFFTFQVTTIILLFRSDVIKYFSSVGS
jgi:hypothetical protein